MSLFRAARRSEKNIKRTGYVRRVQRRQNNFYLIRSVEKSPSGSDLKTFREAALCLLQTGYAGRADSRVRSSGAAPDPTISEPGGGSRESASRLKSGSLGNYVPGGP